MARRMERIVGGLSEGEEILPNSRCRSGIFTCSSHILQIFRPIGHAVIVIILQPVSLSKFYTCYTKDMYFQILNSLLDLH
jgi:hypothetical protein